MAIGDDFSINSSGDIRHGSGTTVYTVLDLHAWLQDLADDLTPTGDDLVSMLVKNPSKLDGPRSYIKPMTLNLLNGFNIDDTAAQFFNFGSISQSNGDTLYTGVKSIGTPLVAGTPIYIVQNGSKLTVYWPNGHIQILVKGKDGGALIGSGDIRAYSRKYGQTYADFAVNLVAGSEQPVAITTSLTSWTTLTLAEAQALSSKVTLNIGDVIKDTGDGNGSKLYKGTITLSGGCTIAEAAQYCQAICDQNSTTAINGVEGWKYRSLDASYTPNGAAPFGAVAGGKWFVAQGWWIEGALAADSQNYQMTSDDGTTISNPIVTVATVRNIESGVEVMVARDDGADWYIQDEYSLAGAHASSASTVTINESIKSDTPESGFIRVGGLQYLYSAFDYGTKTFTLTTTLGQDFADASPCFVPFIDVLTDSSEESSANFTFNSNFNLRVLCRKGSSPNSKQEFNSIMAVTSAGASINAILAADE